MLPMVKDASGEWVVDEKAVDAAASQAMLEAGLDDDDKRNEALTEAQVRALNKRSKRGR